MESRRPPIDCKIRSDSILCLGALFVTKVLLATMNDIINAPHRDFKVILGGVPEPYTPVAFTPSRISLPALK
jgi:hypothetical protein